MHRTRATLALTVIALAATGCGNQSTGRSITAVGQLGVAASTSAAGTSAAGTAAAATTDGSPAATSAAPTTTSVAATAIPTVTTTPPAAATFATGAQNAAADAATGDTIFHVNAASAARPHFSTPESAMRYLAAAWNSDDITALKHVTEPNARLLLLGMKREAVNLRLDHCEKRDGGNGDYLCHFTHDYPTAYPKKLREGTHGTSEFIAAPSASVGWYMFQYEGCG
jgi:hypothetical protein